MTQYTYHTCLTEEIESDKSKYLYSNNTPFLGSWRVPVVRAAVVSAVESFGAGPDIAATLFFAKNAKMSVKTFTDSR